MLQKTINIEPYSRDTLYENQSSNEVIVEDIGPTSTQRWYNISQYWTNPK